MAKKYIIDKREINGETQIQEWVRGRINRDAVEFAEQFGKDLATMKDDKKRDQSLTTAQIRNVFGEVRRIQMINKKAKKEGDFDESSILLLKPKLAYSAKRAERKAVNELADVLSKGIDAVVEKAEYTEKIRRFENFANFFEAVLAYHKANETKSKS
jgi:CRISPR-associated protein Csm2